MAIYNSEGERLTNLVDGKFSRGSVRANFAIDTQEYPVGIGSMNLGTQSKATGNYAFAEGSQTIASGMQAHAEGSQTIASGMQAHAEGHDTRAESIASHAEGVGTVSASIAQHVQGNYNVIDNVNQYLDIVGNGYYDEQGGLHRKNISSLTRQGDLHLSGDVYSKSLDDGQGGSKLATEAWANETFNRAKFTYNDEENLLSIELPIE